MKVEIIVPGIFGTFGAGMLLGTLFWVDSIHTFRDGAKQVPGTVVELESDWDDGSTTYFPVVAFTTLEGRNVTFTASTGSNPPAFEPGEAVAVLYDPQDPQDAVIDAFFSLWFGPIIVGFMGLVFSLVGGGVFYFTARAKRRRAELRRHGTPVEATIQSIEQNRSVSTNGKHPYHITAQWQNPATLQIHVFTSENIWYDPAQYVTRPTITVLIDREDPQNHLVDITFLPTMAR